MIEQPVDDEIDIMKEDKESTKKFREELKNQSISNKAFDSKRIVLDNDTRVYLSEDGIKISRRKKNTDGDWVWKDKRVYAGKIEPKAKMIIDEIVVYKYIGDTEQVDNMQNIIRKMKQKGGVLAKNLLDDCVNASFLDLPVITGHATYGVYENNDNLELCLEAMPLKDMQKKIQMRCESSLNQELTKESLLPYFNIIDHWHPYEVLPSMGISAISPFSLMLRKLGMLVPVPWHFSPVSRLGKSTVQRVFSMYLFSIYPQSGNSADSNFRLSSIFDGICGYCIIDEADKVEWSKLESILKEAPENYICNLRGTPDLEFKEFHSRAVIGINSNRFKITNKTTLVRILKIEFDTSILASRAGNEQQVDDLNKTLSELKPIGWRLAELEIEDLEKSFHRLLERIGTHESEFKKLYKKFVDPRRATAWAIIYEGLKIWELASIKYGLEWRAPSYEEFTKDVIDKIETSTRETGETPIADFLHWWKMWKVKNKSVKKTRVGYDDYFLEEKTTGEGEIWAEKKELEHDKKYNGDVITKVIIREYRKDKHYSIDSLADIAKTIQLVTGIPKDKLLKTWRIGSDTVWGVFIPDDMWKYNKLKEEQEEQKGSI